MSELFLQILNMSFTGGIVIVLVLLVRLLLKRTPKLVSYALWGVVLFRLVCPFSFESVVSLLPTQPVPIPQNIGLMKTPAIDTGITFINNAVNAVLPAATPYASVNPMQLHIATGGLVWVVGIAAMLTYSVVSLAKLQARLRHAVHESGNIYRSSELDTPFVIGLFRPRIYLPASLGEEERTYILLHEQMHLRRLDHVVKLASFAVLCLHWFNPLVWVAFFASGKDMEMSCDEAVIKKLGAEVKKDYSASLLTLATGRRLVGGTPLAFGEGDTKSRIKHVLDYKKPTFWVALVAAATAVALGIGLMANPIPTRESMAWVQNLIVADVQSIELVMMPGEQYVKFEPSQHEGVVKLLNQSRGRYIAEPEPIAGGGIAYYINTTDGMRHLVENVGNVYLVIDGESYDTPRNWLGEWSYLDGGELPKDFDYGFTADTSSAAKLWEARTPYVGNNSAVSKLVGLLPAPNGLRYEHMELHTSSQPYEIKIVYSAATEVMDQYESDDGILAATIYSNAILLFALVDNVDTIETTVSDSTRKMIFYRDRAWADKTVGIDVRSFAESAENLLELLSTDGGVKTAGAVSVMSNMGSLDELPVYKFYNDFVYSNYSVVNSGIYEGSLTGLHMNAVISYFDDDNLLIARQEIVWVKTDLLGQYLESNGIETAQTVGTDGEYTVVKPELETFSQNNRSTLPDGSPVTKQTLYDHFAANVTANGWESYSQIMSSGYFAEYYS